MNFLELQQAPDLALNHSSAWELKAGQIKIWELNLEVSQSELSILTDTLSGDELARAERFKFARDRRRYIAARAGLRAVLAKVLGEAAEALIFKYSDRGKPSLSHPDSGQGRLCFNISHSGDLALVALAWNVDLGVDLEFEREDRAFLDMAQFALNAPERAWLESQPGGARTESFYRIWTLKEAVLKATGEGLGSALRSYCIIPDFGDSAKISDYEGGQALGLWKAKSFVSKLGYRAAIAYQSQKIHEIQMDSGTSFAI